MKRHFRMILVAGAGLILGADAALAQMAPRPPSPDLYGPGSLRGRLATRALRDFDVNKDGKITKAELDKVLSQRFSQTSGGAPTMTEAQLEKSHENMLRKHSMAMFHRIDWSGDGVLSLDEFRAPLRARFERMDRDGTGAISCAPHARSAKGTRRNGRVRNMRRRHFSGARAKLCRDADLNRDGKITRSEFDKAVADEFAAATKGGHSMTADAFYQLELSQFKNMEARRFKRLDKNHDGKLSRAEFSAPALRLFTRLDKNNDGLLASDELARAHHGRRHGPHAPWGKKPG